MAAEKKLGCLGVLAIMILAVYYLGDTPKPADTPQAAEARADYARLLEKSLSQNNAAVTARLEDNSRTLRLTDPKFTAALVSGLLAASTLLDDLGNLGFTRVIFTNGKEIWTFGTKRP